jgi:DNA-binding MarR family transcriptional regulator
MPAPLRFDPIEEAARQWRLRWGKEPLAAMRAVTSVMRVQQLWLRRLNEAVRPYGLTFARYEVLMLLYFSRTGALPLGKIGERLQVHPTSVTSLIDGLERHALVRREPHPSDRRATLAAITAEGRCAARAATNALHAIRFGTAPLSDEQLDLLAELLVEPRRAAGDFVEEGEAGCGKGGDGSAGVCRRAGAPASAAVRGKYSGHLLSGDL